MALEFQSPGFSDALVILGAAGVVIPAFARFRVTPVIGFILVGILVGPFGLGSMVDRYAWLSWITISEPEAMEPFAELGIILLLFSIGLELSFKRLWSMRRRVFGFGAAELVGASALIAGALTLFGQQSSAAIGLGLALALSSTALVLPISGTKSAVGRLAFAMLLFEDLALVPIIFLLGALGVSASGGFATMAGILVLGIATIIIMLIFGRFLLPHLFAQAARTKSPELFLSVSLLVVIVSSLVTTAVGLSPIVGALIAGLVIAETEYREEVEHVTAPFRGLALGIFLISVGMSLDLMMIAAFWPQIFSAVAGVVVIKTLVTTLLLRLGKVRAGIATEVGVLMASPSETTLIVLAAATQVALISLETAAFWQVVTAIGLTITPLLARIGHDVARRIEWQHGSAATENVPIDGARTIIIGYGRVGHMVADMLDTHGQLWVAIEANIDVVTEAKRLGKPVRFGDVRRAASLDDLSPQTAKAVVLTMDDPVQAVHLTQKLRQDFPDLTLIARARDPNHAAQLYRAGISDAVPETLESSLQLSEAVLVDLGVPMGPVIASIHEKRDELRAAIMVRGRMTHKPKLGTSKLGG
ncbi:MAG: cation:proton antiporter [Chakrabartia sp.]